MTTTLLIIQIATFGLAMWLGLYLISRNLADVRLRLAGAGLVAYAVGLALDLLAIYAPAPALLARLAWWQRPLFLLPALFWLILLGTMLAAADPLRVRLQRHPKPVGVIVAAATFFGLGLGLLLFPFDWLPRSWVLLAIGGDLLALGLAVGVLDAFDEGESLRPHMLGSFSTSLFTALLFGGQVALVMALSTGVTFSLLLLLLTIITAALLLQTFADPLQAALDQIAFLRRPHLRQRRAELRRAADAAARVDESLDPAALEEEEFARLTRRALSHMGNLPRLAGSPLTRLSLVEARLAPDPAGTLDRAAELKTVLTESIERLKPPDKGEFGTSDEWRHYNSLYFPYVVGLRPYSRRADYNGLETAVQDALDWFRSQVPERTLYNWQNSAARLIAQDLRERSVELKGERETQPFPQLPV